MTLENNHVFSWVILLLRKHRRYTIWPARRFIIVEILYSMNPISHFSLFTLLLQMQYYQIASSYLHAMMNISNLHLLLHLPLLLSQVIALVSLQLMNHIILYSQTLWRIHNSNLGGLQEQAKLPLTYKTICALIVLILFPHIAVIWFIFQP